MRVTILYFLWLWLLVGGVQAAEPEWLRMPHAGFPFEKFFAGSASVPFRKRDNREDAKQQAYDKALSALSREISVEVKALTEDFLQTVIKGDQEDTSAAFKESIAVTTKNEIRLAQVKNEQVWKRVFRGDEYCVRVVLDRADMAKRLYGVLAEKRLQAEGHYESAVKALGKADLASALRHLVQARLARVSDFATEALWRTVKPRASSESLPGPSLGDLSALLEKVSADLRIRPVRGQGQPLRQGGRLLEPLVVQVTVKAGDRDRPVAGLPLSFLFQNATGQMAGGNSATDAGGLASARVARVAPEKGSSLVAVRVGVALKELVRGFNAEDQKRATEWLSPLETRATAFTFRPPPKWQAWVKAFAGTLHSELALHDCRSIVLGSFRMKGEQAVGPFGDGLRQALAKELKLSGTTLTQWGSKRQAPVLWGEYSVENDLVDVGWQVVRWDEKPGGGGTMGLLASGNRKLLREQLPGVKFKPSSLEKIRARLARVRSTNQSPGKEALRVEMWTNHGPRPVYREGEEMQVFLRANRACNVQLIYTDSDGVSFFILPNVGTGRAARAALEPGQVRMVPDGTRGERWRLRFSSEGRGMEALVALASSGPLAMPTRNADYPVYAFGYRLEHYSLQEQISRSHAETRAAIVLHQER